jgi:hypothetical protein
MKTLERGFALNQQTLFGKERKPYKTYVNAYFDDLCHMSDEEVKKDKQEFAQGNIRNYFDSDFKKAFKVRKVDGQLCYLRDDKYIPLRSSSYGFIVSPKGGLYAIEVKPNFLVANKEEIQNSFFYHSLFRAGQPVQSAGFFYYEQGKPFIHSAYRDSGHYKPTAEQHLRACNGLTKAGLMNADTLIGGRKAGRGPVYPLGQFFPLQQAPVDNSVESVEQEAVDNDPGQSLYDYGIQFSLWASEKVANISDAGAFYVAKLAKSVIPSGLRTIDEDNKTYCDIV